MIKKILVGGAIILGAGLLVLPSSGREAAQIELETVAHIPTGSLNEPSNEPEEPVVVEDTTEPESTPGEPVNEPGEGEPEAPPEPEIEPEPVLVTNVVARTEGDVTYCDLTYSDETSSSRVWKRTVTHGSASMEVSSGSCNDSLIGQLK